MKKIIFTAAALVVLAGSTFSALPTTQTVAQKSTKPSKPGATTSAIPPASCPANDPNGCGILD